MGFLTFIELSHTQIVGFMFQRWGCNSSCSWSLRQVFPLWSSRVFWKVLLKLCLLPIEVSSSETPDVNTKSENCIAPHGGHFQSTHYTTAGIHLHTWCGTRRLSHIAGLCDCWLQVWNKRHIGTSSGLDATEHPHSEVQVEIRCWNCRLYYSMNPDRLPVLVETAHVFDT